MDYLRGLMDAEYRRAFRSAARKQPWALFLVLLFDAPGMSFVAYFRLVRGLGPTAQESLLVVALFLLTGLFVYRVGRDAWSEVRQENVTLEERLKPRLELVLDPTRYPACMQQTRSDGGAILWRVFRVALVNTSHGETVDDVEVLLAGIEGLDPKRTSFLPAHLMRMGDVEGVRFVTGGPLPLRLNPGHRLLSTWKSRKSTPIAITLACGALANTRTTLSRASTG
jgi:hypothetical protein